MNIEFPDNIATRKNLSKADLKTILAISLYKMEKINGVEGGIITGHSEIEFHGLVQKYGHAINYDVRDLQQDIDHLKNF